MSMLSFNLTHSPGMMGRGLNSVDSGLQFQFILTGKLEKQKPLTKIQTSANCTLKFQMQKPAY